MLMTCVCKDDRRCILPLGYGFCGSPKRVGQAENAVVVTHATSLLKKTGAPSAAREHGGWVMAKAEMHCPVSWAPRAAAVRLEWRGGDETRRTDGRTDGLWVSSLGETRTVCVGGPDAVTVLVTCGHEKCALALLGTVESPPVYPQREHPIDHMMPCARGTGGWSYSSGGGGHRHNSLQ